MPVPYAFSAATSAIPLSQLDANFNTTITLGNTAIQLGNTVTTLNNMTLANVTISSGNVTLTNVTVTTANVTTANITNLISGNVSLTGGAINGTTLGASTAASANVTTLTTSSTVTLNGGTANGVAYLNGSKVLTTGSALVFDGANLGLGVTPSAWSQGRAIELINPGYGFWNGSGSPASMYMLANAYFNSGFKYGGTGQASHYYQYQGAHVWSTAASGTAGNAITFTQAMTLTADGNLGIGVTNPTNISGYKNVQASANDGALFTVESVTGAMKGVLVADRFVGVSVGSTTNHLLSFITNNTERARITSGGSFFVGVTSEGGNANGVTLNASTGYQVIQHASGTASSTRYSYFYYNGGEIGSITQDGTTGVLYNITSDQRLKENIVDAPAASSLIDDIQVRSFDWKSDGSHQRYGFIAQELVAVAPEAVHQPSDPDEMMGVDYSKLVPMLVKEIQSLRQRVAQLEGA